MAEFPPLAESRFFRIRSCPLLFGFSSSTFGQTADFVILISVDGLHAGQLQTLMRENPETYSNFPGL